MMGQEMQIQCVLDVYLIIIKAKLSLVFNANLILWVPNETGMYFFIEVNSSLFLSHRRS